jgi:hypothetical protein
MRGNRITALHQYAPAPHKKQGVFTYFVCALVTRAGSRAPP